MTSPFSHDDETAWGRVLQTYTILVEHALRRSTMLYGVLAVKLGVFPPSVGLYLDPVARYCQDEGLPDLTALAVSAETGEPSSGYLGSPGSVYLVTRSGL